MCSWVAANMVTGSKFRSLVTLHLGLSWGGVHTSGLKLKGKRSVQATQDCLPYASRDRSPHKESIAHLCAPRKVSVDDTISNGTQPHSCIIHERCEQQLSSPALNTRAHAHTTTSAAPTDSSERGEEASTSLAMEEAHSEGRPCTHIVKTAVSVRLQVNLLG